MQLLVTDARAADLFEEVRYTRPNKCFIRNRIACATMVYRQVNQTTANKTHVSVSYGRWDPQTHIHTSQSKL